MTQGNDAAAGGVPMVDLWRGGRLESRHRGHAVIIEADEKASGIVEAWGDPGALLYPRSSCKMIQALPLLESGAGRGLGPAQLALACASHSGGAVHVQAVERWLSDMGMAESDLRCGCQEPSDRDERNRLIRLDAQPCQIHNNCSGKHAGFLMLNRHLKGDPEYVDPDHPLQRLIRQVTDEVTDETSPGYGIDGCSAPNFAMTLAGLARAMAAFAAAQEGDSRGRAMVALRQAMAAHPEMVAGEGRACTELMRAMDGVAIKTGAEAVFVAILPARDGRRARGIALKIADGGTRAAEAAITALLIREGVLDPAHPAAVKRLGPMTNWRGLRVGELRLAPGFG